MWSRGPAPVRGFLPLCLWPVGLLEIRVILHLEAYTFSILSGLLKII